MGYYIPPGVGSAIKFHSIMDLDHNYILFSLSIEGFLCNVREHDSSRRPIGIQVD